MPITQQADLRQQLPQWDRELSDDELAGVAGGWFMFFVTRLPVRSVTGSDASTPAHWDDGSE